MACFLKQSTAVDIALGPFVDSTDGFTPETALSITQAEVRLKKNAGNWAQKNQASSATHEEEGWYEINLNTADTDTLGILMVAVYVSGALPVWREFSVVPANVYDSLYSTDLLQVDVQQFGNAAGTFNGGRAEVNASHAAGTAWNSGAIGANTLAAGTITAAKFAANALDAAALAADAVAEIADGVWDEAIVGHQAAGSMGRNLTLAASVLGEFTLTGVPTSSVLRISGGSAVNNFYADLQLLITSGALLGQARPILSYDGATGDITVDEPFTSAPAAGVTVAVLASHAHPISQIADAVWDEDATAHQTQGSFGQAIGDPGADTDTLFALVNSIAATVGVLPSALQVADALLDRMDGVESGLTPREFMRVAIAALAGVSMVSGGQRVYRSIDGAKARISATVSNGDRTSVTLDKS